MVKKVKNYGRWADVGNSSTKQERVELTEEAIDSDYKGQPSDKTGPLPDPSEKGDPSDYYWLDRDPFGRLNPILALAAERRLMR